LEGKQREFIQHFDETFLRLERRMYSFDEQQRKGIHSFEFFLDERLMESVERLLVPCLLLIILEQVSPVSYNQSKICPNASWSCNGITFANNNTIGNFPYTLFIPTNNTIFTARHDNGQIVIWRNASVTPTTTIPISLSYPYSLFVTDDEEIFLSINYPYPLVDRWESNSTRLSSMMMVCSSGVARKSWVGGRRPLS
jgi:hypothetical protein